MAGEKKKKSSIQKAMKNLGKVEEAYAKIIINCSNKVRLKLYRKIASLMRNRFSLMDALDMLHDSASKGGKNPGEPLAIALAAWGKSLNNGKTFSDALQLYFRQFLTIVYIQFSQCSIFSPICKTILHVP